MLQSFFYCFEDAPNSKGNHTQKVTQQHPDIIIHSSPTVIKEFEQWEAERFPCHIKTDGTTEQTLPCSFPTIALAMWLWVLLPCNVQFGLLTWVIASYLFPNQFCTIFKVWVMRLGSKWICKRRLLILGNVQFFNITVYSFSPKRFPRNIFFTFLRI